MTTRRGFSRRRRRVRGGGSYGSRSSRSHPSWAGSSGVGLVVERGGEGGVAASTNLPAQRRVGGEQCVAVELAAGVVEAVDAALDVTGLGGRAFRIDVQVTDDADAFAGRGGFDGDPGRAHGEDLTDGWAVQPCHCASCASEEDVGDRGALTGVGALVDVEHDLPRGARLYPVEVAQGHDGP